MTKNKSATSDWLHFWSHVEKTASCWLWQGATRWGGYGCFSTGGHGGKLVAAHRFAYENCIGMIPDGLQLDHLCRVRNCVNPQHLEPVTNQENGLRGVGAAAINARKTHCKKGHPLGGSHLGMRKNGYWRYCRTCTHDSYIRRKANTR